MIKKRRDFANCEVFDLINNKSSLKELIAIKTEGYLYEGLSYRQYNMLPKYGTGAIIIFEMESIKIIINRFILKKDIVVYNKSDTDYMQLSFLLEGEKIISLDSLDRDIYYENQEGYLVCINSFNGYSRIFSKKIFKEIKIKMPKHFFVANEFATNFKLKKLSDKGVITPTTIELLTTLTELETKNLKGIAQKIFLKAKVFELLALQIENYKHVGAHKLNGSKVLKKAHKVSQIIKNNLQNSYTAKQLAIEVALNEHLLKKVFKKVYGHSVTKFTIIERMKKSRYLLKDPQLAIYQIAEDVGYKNATHFTAAFKRHFGNSPTYYRTHL